MKSFGLEIDQEACWGCLTCIVACKQENGATDAASLIKVSENGPHLQSDRLEFTDAVNVCRHCEIPACVTACPAEAISQRVDGIVILDAAQCTGCQLCLDACPYEAIFFDEVENTARKCNLCYHRVDQGLMPACADNVCLAHCIAYNKV